MKYKIKPTMFKKSDRLVIYFKKGKWNLYTFTDGYKLNKKDKDKLISYCCEEKNVAKSDVRVVKIKRIIGIDE